MNNLRLSILFLVWGICTVWGQSTASIKEETLSIATYGFDTPNPIPIVTENPKIPPYFKYEGYAHNAKERDWKVITLENDYIKLWVLPEIGGKVWGAIDKGTGHEFLYKNKVVKFRNIAMRGPWTSGGIEFNFGIIGHHPSTATPVNYHTKTNADGSVSCFVGNDDLPSQTRWMVEIRLEPDKAYFETNVSWYNASPLTESYYNWMTAAAVATDDLEFFIPGNAYVEHNGDAHPWPIDDQGRNLAMYKNNAFGPAKSYHVVGEYNDFFGGYYHNRDFGYGQWAPYEEMPGQKLWLWALSRSGGIWEDLLTDTDGQYIEFQAGRLFDQYFPGAVNPISQVGFDPYVMDTWSEIWFPYKEIGGMEDASKHGVLNVEYQDGSTYIGLNALQSLHHELQVKVNGKPIFSQQLELKPMEVFSTTIAATPQDTLEIAVLGTELEFSSDPSSKQLKRPFYPDSDLSISEAEALYQSGMEALEYREYDLAREKLSALVAKDPSHRSGILGLAELEYRRTHFEKALELVHRVLKMDTYDSKANYLAGIAYRTLDDSLNALESLGWAARDIKYRSVAYAQMAEIHLKNKTYTKAKTYAQKALAFNTHNINAIEVLMLVAKYQDDPEVMSTYVQKLLHLDPLHGMARLESQRGKATQDDNIVPELQNELPHETVLDLALRYRALGDTDTALALLWGGPESVKNRLWKAYLLQEEQPLESQGLLKEALAAKVDLVFPYRRETLPMLQWAAQESKSWKAKYYLAQNYLAVNKQEEALQLLADCGSTPDSDIFYRFRAKARKNQVGDQLADYQKAYSLNPTDWKLNEEFIQYYLANDAYPEAAKLSAKAYRKFPDNYNIGLAHSKSLLLTGSYRKVLEVLQKIQVLPFEHASESRDIYERAHEALALSFIQKKHYSKALEVLERSKEWPEHIGVGKPYGPDERSQDYLMALTLEGMGQMKESRRLLNTIVDKTKTDVQKNTLDHLYGLLAAKKLDQRLLEELVNTLKATQNTKSEEAITLAIGSEQEVAQLRTENQWPDDVWNTIGWAIQR